MYATIGHHSAYLRVPRVTVNHVQETLIWLDSADHVTSVALTIGEAEQLLAALPAAIAAARQQAAALP